MKNPSLQSIYKIAKAFGISLNDLLEGIYKDKELFTEKKIRKIRSDL